MEKDKIEGGLADNQTPESIANKHGVSLDTILDQLKKGINVEKEHTNDDLLAKEIALDHLVEDPIYYDKLATIEEDEGGAPGSATLDSVPGMGAIEPANPGVIGSGDVLTTGPSKKKKKIKGFEEFTKGRKKK